MVLPLSIPTDLAPNDTFPVLYREPYSPTNPISSSTPITLDPSTGLFSVTPNLFGYWEVSMGVKEYRNGVYLGQTNMSFAVLSSPDCGRTIQMDIRTDMDYGNCSLQKTIQPSVNLNPPYDLYAPADSIIHYRVDFGDPTTLADTLRGKGLNSLYYINYTYPDTGLYTMCISVAPEWPCGITQCKEIKVRPALYNLSIDTLPPQCANSPFDISVHGYFKPSANFEWNTWNSTVLVGGDTSKITLQYATPGTYSITAMIDDRSGNSFCNKYLNTVVVITDNLPVDLGADTRICEGDSLSLKIGYSPTYTYLWNTGDTSNYITVNEAGQYILSVTQNGCYASDTVNIVVDTLPNINIVKNILENGCSDIVILANQYGNNGYLTWNTGSHTVSIVADSSKTYTLTIDNGGCHAKDTIQVQLPGAYVTLSTTVSICQGQGYYAGGANQSLAGIYYDTITSTVCDTIRITNLIVYDNYTMNQTTTICQGQNYQGHTTSGTYSSIYTTVHGCDSVVSTVLTVTPAITTSQTATICQGQNYQGNTTSGTYSATYTTASGCDSVVSTVLTVTPAISISQNKTICQGQSYQGHTTTGIYFATYTTASGCDSNVITSLQVVAAVTSAENKTICQGQSYQGHTTSGIYQSIYTSIGGCDSIVTINLTVKNSTTNSITVTICAGKSYYAGGANQTVAGTYTDVLQNSYGCDSILTTNLLITTLDDNFTIAPAAYLLQGQTAIITATQNQEGYTHIWLIDGQLTSITNGATFNYNDAPVGEHLITHIINAGTSCNDTLSLPLIVIGNAPNIITPNEDGKNDTWIVDFLEKIPTNKLTIYNRWGNIVYESSPYKNDWKATDLSDGVYFYVLQLNAEAEYKGTITVINK